MKPTIKQVIMLLFAGVTFFKLNSQETNTRIIPEGIFPVTMINDPAAHTDVPGNENILIEQDYNYSQVAGISHWSTAVATVPPNIPTAGRIWLAATHYSGGLSDSLKLFFSDNGGVSWVYYTQTYFPGFSTDFRSDEIDMEICYDNSNVWLFIVASYQDYAANRNYSALFRYRVTGAFSSFFF